LQLQLPKSKLLLTHPARVCVGIKLCILHCTLNPSCNANANSPQTAKFQNSIFLPLQIPPPAQRRPGLMPPFPPPLRLFIKLAQRRSASVSSDFMALYKCCYYYYYYYYNSYSSGSPPHTGTNNTLCVLHGRPHSLSIFISK